MAQLSDIRDEITAVVQSDLLNPAYLVTTLDNRINRAVSSIAAGIRMPNGQISPPLPDLYSSGTVATATDAAYKALPATYQRNVFMIADDSNDKILPVSGGSYYDFMLFLDSVTEKDLSETGSIYRVAIKGSNLYYQGIPSSSEDLTVHFYRKPVDMSADSDTPDGLPDHLQYRLIKHAVVMDIFADDLKEDFKSAQLRELKIKYHIEAFYSAMADLVDFIGIDEIPVYLAGGNSGFQDLGICD